ncbi:MAG: hypothetical protein IPM29_22780 [Planctomycetes bacterium]|nr:hypothetical protein [Planctomycetota bacterium]
MRTLLIALALACASAPANSQIPPGEQPNLPRPRVQQADIQAGQLSLFELRSAGLRMFATPFNIHDGLGDGPMNPSNPTAPGGRPSLQSSPWAGNGMFLRVNGLDAQTCMECHSVGSNATVPFRFAVGGVGGSNNNVMAKPTAIDVGDRSGNGFAAFDGRFINPPFLFGSGGVELVAKEMTLELQRVRERARRHPDRRFRLVAKGVEFGSILFSNGTYDLSRVEGVDTDLVVRPFGRKGEFATARAFDVEAMQFHFGMQPVEVFGAGVDADQDGVTDEILPGELSALHVFDTNLERPVQQPLSPSAQHGRSLFQSIGCTDCHVPAIDTDSRWLTYSFPEVHADPRANVYFAADLTRSPAGFDRAPRGPGIRVPMFSDLKRHDMGPRLSEATGAPLDRFFVTARLWGVADTAPYLHDGRATTLSDAIEYHGGEAQTARDRFMALPPFDKQNLLAFLRTLRTPLEPAADLLARTDEDE